MVDKADLEFESILYYDVVRLEGADKETNGCIAKLEKSINERSKKTEKKKEGCNKIDDHFDKIMTAISALKLMDIEDKGKEKELAEIQS
ncbi:hypothetical protein OnM2_074032 [Erysiphe neolycopersici]|uniref:Uncharacterized protein n=1 Tax=Erysiphe neolycopersici TaxID=212602 RepID=A0A420HIU0_9PEZI|nr:hypothetical protein OnM2_074032 [Erysiphe neolycopersici]